jgi:histidine triad (HIT) family protein
MIADCIFCKIIAGTIPAAIIAQNSDLIVIKDIQPKAPTHYLIIPRKHIKNIQDIAPEDAHLFGSIALMAQQLSQSLPVSQDFRLISNNGPHVGQTVFHLHTHFLAGKLMSDF